MTSDMHTRRELLAAAAAVGAVVVTGSLPAKAATNDVTKTFTILHTNDMHSAFIGMAPAADYNPFKLNDDNTRGGLARLASVIARRREARKDLGPATSAWEPRSVPPVAR